MDVVGEQQNNVDHSVHKIRLKNGIPFLEKEKTNIGDTSDLHAHNKTRDANYCGSCYGGVNPPSGCCNTCREVELAYEAKGWTVGHMEKFEQVYFLFLLVHYFLL